jgi:cysteinyl-tRNA synthetase
MDFTWEALEGAQTRLRRLRQRMADWSTAVRSSELSAGAAELDRRFRDAVADDLDMPRAIEVLSDTVSADVPDGDKFALLSSWDAVLGLDLGRAVRQAGDALPEDVQALVAQRDEARAARDFARSDELRSQLTAMGYEVNDTPEGTRVRPL